MTEGSPSNPTLEEVWEIDPRFVSVSAMEAEQQCTACGKTIVAQSAATKIVLRRKGWQGVSKGEQKSSTWRMSLFFHPACVPKKQSDLMRGGDAFYKRLPGSFEQGKRR